MQQLLKMTEAELFEHVVAQFKRDNPQLKRGQRMNGPVGLAEDGVMVEERLAVSVAPRQVVQAQTQTFTFNEDGVIENMECSRRGWFYPYMVQIPHTDVLTKKVGDDFIVADAKTFKPMSAKLEQRHIDERRSIIVRLGFTGDFQPEPESFI